MKKKMSFGKLLEAYKKASKTGVSVLNQSKLFKKNTGYSRRTFFQLKYYANNGKKQNYASYSEIAYIYRKCWFCSRKSKVVHHIDENRNNNKSSNLIALCMPCHVKLHNIYSKLKRS